MRWVMQTMGGRVRRRGLARVPGLVALALGALLGMPWAARADYPERPIKLIVPFAAGGGVDVLARPLAQELGTLLKQPVVVENRASATGQLGAAEVAKAAPDGYTLLISSAAFATTPSFVPRLPYDIFKDFEPVTIVAQTPQLLVVPTALKATSFADVLRLARSGQPLNFALPGSSGIQRLATELLISSAQLGVTQVPYKGAGAAFTDLIAGRVDLMFDNPGSSMVHVKSGRLRVLASTGLTRMATLPDVPAVAETVPGFEALNWFVLAAPAGTPPAVLDRLQQATAEVLRGATMRQMLERDGLQGMGNGREQARQFLRAEFGKWNQVIREKNLTAD
ncbi:MAG: tripartite tricarboxylate transporter substrate binding protein [Rubrivivax sp.]